MGCRLCLEERETRCHGGGSGDVPIYVGIANNLRRRVPEHLSADPGRANLAVCMAAKALGAGRSGIKQRTVFDAAFALVSAQLRDCRAVWLEVENPLAMYLFEPCVAMKLDTSQYNFFGTLQVLSPKYRGTKS